MSCRKKEKKLTHLAFPNLNGDLKKEVLKARALKKLLKKGGAAAGAAAAAVVGMWIWSPKTSLALRRRTIFFGRNQFRRKKP